MNGGGRQSRPGLARCLARSYDGETWRRVLAPVVREENLDIHLNGRRLVSVSCGGLHPEELAVGWLRGEGFISSRRELEIVTTGNAGRAVFVCTAAAAQAGPAAGRAMVIAASGARTTQGGRRELPRRPLVAGPEKISPGRIFTLMDEMVAAAALHRLSRGTHAAALAGAAGLLAVREDIGRHNCLDMLSGYCLLNDLDGGDKLLLRTGRVSAEIVDKIWRMGVPVAASLSVPTARAVRIARQAGITLLGAVRRPSLMVYTHPERIGET